MLENTFIFSDLQDNEIIGSHTSDANTTHISKMVRNRALKNIKVRKITGIFTAGNEVSFYRNLRNHSRISTRNKGGRVIPDAYCIYEEGLEELSERKIEILKKNQVPIYVLHTDKYEEKEIEEKMCIRDRYRVIQDRIYISDFDELLLNTKKLNKRENKQ